MAYDGEEFSRRLELLSDDTLRLSSEIRLKENLFKFFDLVKTIDSEEIIAEEIKRMLDSPEEKEMALIAPELHKQRVMDKIKQVKLKSSKNEQ